MITELPGKEFLEPLPPMMPGARCTHHLDWAVEFNGQFYSFKSASWFYKDAWLRAAISEIGSREAVALMVRFCHICRTLQP